MLDGVVGVLVDAHDDGGVDVGAGRGDDHLAGARPQVCRRGGARAEQAGRLHDDVDAEVLPWKIFRIGLLQDADLVTVDVEPTTGDLDGADHAPYVESWRRRWASVSDGARSLTATTSIAVSEALPARSVAIRIRSRPIRPIPLMPTRTRMSSPFLGCRCSHRGCVSAAAATVDRPFRWARGPCVRGSPPSSVRWRRTDGRAQQHDSFQVACADHPDDPLGVGDEDQVSARARGSLEHGPPGTDVPDDARCARPDRPVSLDPVARRCIVDH